MAQKTAYVTGGASGIAKEVAAMLDARGVKVVIADRDLEGAKATAASLKNAGSVHAFDAGSWESQLATFEKVVQELGRIDYVYPIAGIGERSWTPNQPQKPGFVKPDLAVLDIDLQGFLYTTSLAIQQMRRQEKDENGFRGKSELVFVAVVASVCGFYCVPTLPIYTAAKHGVVGFCRSFGKYLPEEGITLNAVCPNVVRTNISVAAFYDNLEKENLLTPMKPVIDAFQQCLDTDISGECLEIGPHEDVVLRKPAEVLDKESAVVLDRLLARGHPLHEPKS